MHNKESGDYTPFTKFELACEVAVFLRVQYISDCNSIFDWVKFMFSIKRHVLKIILEIRSLYKDV